MLRIGAQTAGAAYAAMYAAGSLTDMALAEALNSWHDAGEGDAFMAAFALAYQHISTLKEPS